MSKFEATTWAAERGEKWRSQLAKMEATLAPIDAPLLDALKLDAPLRIADVACGGGGTTLELRKRAPKGSAVHGFDISRGLIETARGRIPADVDGVLTFEEADLGVAAPPDGPFDRLSSRFGTMFFEDPPAAFRNLARWLKPGGRFAFAVWAKPADNHLTSIPRNVVAASIDVPPPVPDSPGPFRYGDVSRLLDLLRAGGFTDVESNEWRGTIAVGGGLEPRAAAEFALAAFSVAEVVASAPADVQAKVRDDLTAEYAKHVQDGVVRVAASVHIGTGSR